MDVERLKRVLDDAIYRLEHGDEWLGRGPGEAEAVVEMKAALAELETGGWISVKERVPEYSCIVLTADLSGHVAASEFYSMSKYWRIAGDEHVLNYVTHWMPLPKPPKA